MKISDLIDLPPDADAMAGLEAVADQDPVVWSMLNRRVKGEALVYDNSRKLSEESLGEIKRTLIQSDYEDELYSRLLHHRPFHRQPLRDKHKHKVFEKSRQVGVTELTATEVFHFLATHPGTKAVITFPRDKQLIDFSNTRFATAFAESPRMAALAGTPNQVFTRRVGDSYALFRSAWESNLGEGIDADYVALDEKDRMRDKVEFAFKESLKSSKHRLFREISTPTLPNAGIDIPFRASDQQVWLVKCKKCGLDQEVTHTESIVQVKDFPLGTKELPPESYAFLCSKLSCRGELDRVFTGRWVPKHPDRKHIRGYHMTQLVAPWISATRVMQDKIDMRFRELWLCLFSGAKVTTRRGAKKIEEIVVGDVVLTHDGTFGKVTETKVRKYTGDRVDLFVGKTTRPTIAVTAEHPMLAVPRSEMRIDDASPKWILASDLKVGDWLVQPRTWSQSRPHEVDFADYVDSNDVEVTSDHVICRNPLTGRVNDAALRITRRWPIDQRAAMFLGLVLAEGTVTKPSIVHGAEEGDLVELSRSTFAALGANPVLVDPYKYPSQRGGKKPGQATRVEAPSRVLAAAFTKLFGGTHRRKRVPRFVLDLPRAERIAFLAGYYNGDGCVLPAELGAVTCSAHIAYGIQMLLSSIGVPLQVSPYQHKQRSGYLSELYRMRITGLWRETLINEMRPHLSDKHGRRLTEGLAKLTPSSSFSVTSDSMNFYYRIRSVKKTPVKREQVYNVEVPGNHSYVANGVVNHNCYVCGIPAAGELEMLNDADFVRACAGHDLMIARPARGWSQVSVGIDWGQLNWVVAMGRSAINQRPYVIGIGVFEDTPKELESAEMVYRYILPFAPEITVADAGYGKDRNSFLLRKLCPNGDEGRFWAQWYNSSVKHGKTFVPEWSDPARARVTVDRTLTLKNICRAVKEPEFGLPALDLPEVQLMIRHLKSLAPFREFDEESKEIVETIKSSGDDHLSHALASAWLGMEKLTKTSKFGFSFE